MINRYQTKKMKHIWSEKNKFNTYLKVELAICYAWNTLGLISDLDYQNLLKASFKISDISKIEKETKHDVIAFTRAVSLSLGNEKRWIHYGLTSTDVVDTANAIRLKEANKVILDAINKLKKTIKQKAYQYKDTPVIGRTHGIHAEITSFGLKYALWYSDLKRIKDLFINASSLIETGKISGAVGNYSAINPKVEEIALEHLNLNKPEISTQVIQRDRYANYISTIALLGSELEKIATEIRHLSRSEVGEVSEHFSENQKGSSAMPHKKNPISSENISGLSRLLRGYMISSYENISLWHERDISHSSVERVILADSTTIIHYMLIRLNKIITNLVVNEEKMLKNINLTYGTIHAQRIIHLLINEGYSRESAYDLVQSIAKESLRLEEPFIDLLFKNKDIKKIVTEEKLKECFDLSKYLVYTNEIFKKVFKKTNKKE